MLRCRWASAGIRILFCPAAIARQVRLHLPSETRAIMNNYDDSFVTGKLVLCQRHAVRLQRARRTAARHAIS